MDFPHGEAVTVVRFVPGGTDPYGDPIPGTTTNVVILGCAVAPRLSTEPTDRGRQGIVVGLTIYAPAGSDILSTDSLMVRGLAYVVEGETAAWRSPFTGWAPGIEVAIRRAAG